MYISAINPTDTPLLYRYKKDDSYLSINQILEVEQNAGIDNRPALLEEIKRVCEGRFWGVVRLGDPMGGGPVTYVGVLASTWKQADFKVNEIPRFSTRFSEYDAMWGCHGFYQTVGEKKESCYFFQFKESSNYPVDIFLEGNEVELFEDMVESDIRHYDLCVECPHVRWQHAVKQCREKDCPCSIGYKEVA